MRGSRALAACVAMVVCLIAVLVGPTASWAGEPAPLTPEQAMVIDIACTPSFPGEFSPADRDIAARVAQLYRQGKSQDAKALWLKLARANAKGHSVADLYAVARWIMRDAYLVGAPELSARAVQAGASRELHSAIRRYIAELKDALLKFPGASGAKVTVPLKTVVNGQLASSGSKPMTRSELQSHIANMGQESAKAADKSKTDLQNLQNAMQKEAQLLQLLSTVSKMMHDTCMAIIRDVGDG